ncbi:hypothetical protein JL720_10572 [Aureococcus anophagefferens]|nr:hypothetical protein JL720_10572 [Aureococcus anophagefferens]
METGAADGLLSLIDAASAPKGAGGKGANKRAHKPRRPYRCGRCGLPKSGHLCALTLLLSSSSSSDDASEGSSAGEHLVRSVTDDARESDDGVDRAKPGGGDDSDRGTHTPPAQRQRIAVS